MVFIRFSAVILLVTMHMWGQSLGNAGTIEGTVADPSGAVVAGAEITLHNVVTGYSRSMVSGSDGSFRLTNIPPHPYRLQVKASGFSVFVQNLDVRNSIQVLVK